MKYSNIINNIKNKYSKFGNNELDYVLSVLDTNNTMDFVAKLEKEFSTVFGAKYAIACNSGTSGLHSALAALDLKKNDEVIVPALTVVMDAYAAIHLNAKPIFADVDENTFLITEKSIKSKLTKKTKAIIVVSLQGLPVDIDPIMRLAKKNKIVVIEDNAQDFYGKYKNKISGTTGDIGVWSFENKKHLSGATEGGIITTNNKILATKMRKFAGIGYKNMSATGGRTSLSISKVQDPNYERFDTIGLNYRMPQIVAAVCLGQFDDFKNKIYKRKKVAEIFRQAILKCDWLVEQKTPPKHEHTHYTFAVRYLGYKKFGIKWKDFYNRYKKLGGDGFYGACVCPHLEPAIINYFKKNLCHECNKFNNVKCCSTTKGTLPNAEKIQKEIMQFKTNYRNINLAKQKAKILKKLIEIIENET